MGTVVDNLDHIVSEIRTAIFALGTRGDGAVRADLLRVVREATEQLGFRPEVRFEGPVDTAIPLEVAAHLLAVAREALSNAARHAHASRVEVVVSAGDEAVLVVEDDAWASTSAPGTAASTTWRSGPTTYEAASSSGRATVAAPASSGGCRCGGEPPLRRAR